MVLIHHKIFILEVYLMISFLTDSANTGKDIMDNPDLFSCTYSGFDQSDDGSVIYKFDWTFNVQQTGYISIKVKNGKMSNSSLIGVDNKRLKLDSFSRPLGLYNDPTLYDLFCNLLQTRCNVTVNEQYSE